MARKLPFGKPMHLGSAPNSSRLNLLIADGAWQDDSFAKQLPPLLSPLGVRCMAARSAAEADRLARQQSVHIAVIDISIPGDDRLGSQEAAGARVIELLRRMQRPPAMVVVRPKTPSLREHRQGLVEALAWGAFAVVDRPVGVEALLNVLHAVVARRFGDRWPGVRA